MPKSKISAQQNHRILVVDDEPAVHKMLTTFLGNAGYEVASCDDGKKVVEFVKKFDPELILMDLMMPGVDGLSASRRIRNMKLSSYLPIIVITARTDIKDMVAALEAGADDYISKPFEFEELQARIKNMLRLKKLQDRLVQKGREVTLANEQISRLNHVLVDTNRQLQKKVYDFHNLFEISFRVMGQLELKKLVKRALLNTLGVFTAKTAMLLLLDPENTERFEIVDVKGFEKENLKEFIIYRHDKLVHYLELIKKPFQIRDVSREFQDILPQLKKLDIEVVAPMFQNEEIVGLICLGKNIKDEPFTEDNLETLAILTNMLSVAVHNAQMYEKIKAMSYTDGMTGLHNYRFFRLRLKEEFARARRSGNVVSLLILDVDYFKNYNDQLGHPAGDNVLRELSVILRSTVRDNDIVCRYGGEEFAIILPGTDAVGSEALAERIRHRVEEKEFFNEKIQPQKTLTVSIGTATFPEDAVTLDDFIVAADRALYHAKKNGRNQVVEASQIPQDL